MASPIRKKRTFAALVLAVEAVLCVGACATSPPPPPGKVARAEVLPFAGDAQAITVARCGAAHPSSDAAASAVALAAPSGDANDDYVPLETRRRKALSKDLCETADDNLARATAEIMADIGRNAPVQAKPWDKKTPPQYARAVETRFHLTALEKNKLAENGFVVLPRVSQTYAWALHEVYESELPIYVSMDAVLFAIFSSNDKLIAWVEEKSLAPMLKDTLARMHCTLADTYAGYPKDVAHDLDLYLTVARSLLEDSAVPSVLGSDDEAATLVLAAKKAEGAATLSLFGRDRYVDWTQYTPRGHYATAPLAYAGAAVEPSTLGPYFRAGMWLSRLELNIVSRSSRSSDPGVVPNPEETPREANVALALSDLADRSGTLADVDKIGRAWTLFAGKREDVSLADLVALRKKGHIEKIDEHSPDELRAAIGNDFQRTARFHRMPEGSFVLPAIATMLGPRVTPDAPAFVPIVNGRIPARYMVHAGDVGALMGLDSAREYIKDDLAKYPGLAAGLDDAKKIVARAEDDKSLYYTWFSAVRSLADPMTGAAPSFTSTHAFQDLTLDSLVSSYGEIRHNYVLMAGQAYDEGGCVVPDGYIEPRPKTLDFLVQYAARGKAAMRELDPEDKTEAQAYFGNLERTLVLMRHIVEDEVEGRPLSTAEKKFLSMVAEMTPGSTGGPPTYTGWYFDMFRTRENEALSTADFIADYYTSTSLNRVAYLGAKAPAMGVFVIDTGGGPRMAVGPVAQAYEATAPLAARLSDETADKAEEVSAPWNARYQVKAPDEVPLSVSGLLNRWGDGEKRPVIVRVRSTKTLSAVKVDVLDHNRHIMASQTHAVVPGKRAEYKFAIPREKARGVRVSVGDYSTEAFGSEMESSVAFGTAGMDPVYDDMKE